MAAKRNDNDEPYDDEEDEDDDEADFVPGADEDEDDEDDDDDDDDEDYADGDDDDDGEGDGIPSLLQGTLSHDPTTGEIVYQDSSFHLSSKDCVPQAWSLDNPLLENPLKFTGWIQDPSEALDFTVRFKRLDSALDPLEEKLLETQEQDGPLEENGDFKGGGKASDENDDDVKVSPSNHHLKQSPANSLKIQSTAVSSNGKRTIYVIEGSQSSTGSTGAHVHFRGMFRSKLSKSMKLICNVQVNTAGAPQASIAANQQALSAAVAKKRTRTDDGDDDSVGNDGSLEYQELIDLHDDAGLSTEELMKRYYGEDAKVEKKDTAKRTKLSGENDEDDDDDAYGF